MLVAFLTPRWQIEMHQLSGGSCGFILVSLSSERQLLSTLIICKISVLQQVNLADLPKRVSGFDTELDWAQILSLGEQQRLSFARLLLTAPKYAILDEATSALDAQNEAQLYEQLLSTKTTFVSVGHRSSLTKYHHLLLELDGFGGWQVKPLETIMTQS
jgi:ABC-type uncharacterized transport system fused permease/ATPase subunit